MWYSHTLQHCTVLLQGLVPIYVRVLWLSQDKKNLEQPGTAQAIKLAFLKNTAVQPRSNFMLVRFDSRLQGLVNNPMNIYKNRYVQIVDGCREYMYALLDFLQYLRSSDQRKFWHSKRKEAPSRDKDLLILLKERWIGPSEHGWGEKFARSELGLCIFSPA